MHFNCLNFLLGMVKPSQSESAVFTMSSEDFPALPGTNPPTVNTNDTSGKATPSCSQTNDSDQRSSSIPDKNSMKRGIVTSTDGNGMFNDGSILVVERINYLRTTIRIEL